MPDPKPSSSNRRAAWLIAIAVVVAIGIFWAWTRSEQAAREEQAAPIPPSTEWTTAPESEGVDVKLPDTPMTNVPLESPAPAEGETSAE